MAVADSDSEFYRKLARRDLIVGILLATLFAVSQTRLSALSVFLLSFATGLYFTTWISLDSQWRDAPRPRVLYALSLLLWPFTVPLYVLATRRGKALLRWFGSFLLWLIVAGTLGVLLGPPSGFTLPR